MRILVAEDDPDISAALRDLLRLRLPNAAITMTTNGEMALWAAENSIVTGRRFDLIISDWTMPKVTGLELLKRIRSHPILARSRFILLTGVANKPQVVEAINAGVNAYITKPLEADILMSKISSVMQSN